MYLKPGHDSEVPLAWQTYHTARKINPIQQLNDLPPKLPTGCPVDLDNVMNLLQQCMRLIR